MSKVIKKENVKRLIRDVKDVLRSPLHDNGIYYKHDETDMLKGYALIIGPEETPYAHGFFLFEIYYPTEYPYLPPKVIYCTNSKNIRFNPNLYVSGKVCLSTLNTWSGDQWTSCETIRSVLLSLCGIFTPVPLLNEPGVVMEDRSVLKYTELIEYYTVDIAIVDILLKKSGVYQPFFDLFYEEMETHYRNNRERILDFVSKKSNMYPNPFIIYVDLYELSASLDYPLLFRKIETI